ncbi:MAG TPA: hypothetical protein VFR11_10490 [Micromonosporaceae bacterium]|jgi:hypothetical protein|nr:hypothetical protein [Micromonosporaceae bacterium]
MTFHTPRWIARSVPVAALGLVLVGGLTACGSSSPGTGGTGGTGGGESTSQICQDLSSQGQALESSILGAMGSLNLTDPNAAASAGPQVITAVKAGLGQLVTVLRAEAAKAADANLRKSLNTAADELNTEIGKITSLDDLQTLGDDMTDVSNLDSFCPDAFSE